MARRPPIRTGLRPRLQRRPPLSALLGVTVIDAVMFFIMAGLALGAAVGLVLQRNPVHSAMLLVATLFAVAVLFVMQQAHFLAAVQVIVYTGAIVVLFLFVIMLLGVDKREDLHETLPFQRQLAAGLGALLLAMILALGRTAWIGEGAVTDPAAALDGGAGTVEALGRSLFSRFLFPFEMTSLLLTVAVIAAVVLARHRSEPTVRDRVEQ